jgi:hypothetical protein
MTDETFYPLTIKNIEQAIVNKAKERNKEMHSEFYSYDAGQYEFIDVNTYADYKLILFRCPKSKSTVSIKINQESLWKSSK